ncbi:MAG: alpha/beta hydrolase [Pseudomonadota bacterium]
MLISIAFLLVFVTLLFGLALLFFPAPIFDWTMTIARRTSGLQLFIAEIDGHQIPYLRGGKGEPLLLLHGFAANKDNWTLIARYLTPHFDLIVPDIPGFGDSARKEDCGYGVDAQLSRLIALVDSLDLDKIHVGGNSMGGYFGSLLGERLGERVKTLWLVAPAGVESPQPSEMQRLVESGDNPLLVSTVADFERLVGLCFVNPPPTPPPFQRVLARRAIAEGAFNQRLFQDLLDDGVSLGDAQMSQRRVLIVWGTEDGILHHSSLEVFKRLYPSAEAILMNNIGHLPMVEKPLEAAQDYLRFQGKI